MFHAASGRRRPATIWARTHLHITSEQSGASGYAERFFLEPTDRALRATQYLERTLMAGFTTVRDLGSADRLNLAVRNAVAKGWIKGPRIVAAGSVTTTGGHGDPTNGLIGELQELLGPRLPGVGDGPDALRAAVRQRYKEGADLIKVAATGGCSASPGAVRLRSSPTTSSRSSCQPRAITG